MSHLHNSKRYDLIHMFNDTSRCLGNILTIDNPVFKKHIPDIFPLFNYMYKLKLKKRIFFVAYDSSHALLCFVGDKCIPSNAATMFADIKLRSLIEI